MCFRASSERESGLGMSPLTVSAATEASPEAAAGTGVDCARSIAAPGRNVAAQSTALAMKDRRFLRMLFMTTPSPRLPAGNEQRYGAGAPNPYLANTPRAGALSMNVSKTFAAAAFLDARTIAM